jgi:arabinose-5-phosphate isomerase
MPVDLAYARQVLKTEAEAIYSLLERLDSDFVRATDMVLACKGRVVVTGMGKAGIIAQKISATLASTGTPSLYLHPAEAYHGDLGRVIGQDTVLILSNSGETEEIVRLVPLIRKIGAKVICITSRKGSTLAKLSDLTLNIGQIEEACPLGLAPSASTTAMLALGDALALCVLKARGFDAEQYAFYHPGGELGRKLMKVQELMRTGDRNPTAHEQTSVRKALYLITCARAGAVSVVDSEGRLTGIFTDGDLRRGMEKDPLLLEKNLKDVMTRTPITIEAGKLATEALALLKERKIDELPVVDGEGRPVGMLDVQDLIAAGLV